MPTHRLRTLLLAGGNGRAPTLLDRIAPPCFVEVLRAAGGGTGGGAGGSGAATGAGGDGRGGGVTGFINLVLGHRGAHLSLLSRRDAERLYLAAMRDWFPQRYGAAFFEGCWIGENAGGVNDAAVSWDVGAGSAGHLVAVGPAGTPRSPHKTRTSPERT